MRTSNLIGVAALSSALLIGCGGNRHAVTAIPGWACLECSFDDEDYLRGWGLGEATDLRFARRLALSSAEMELRRKFFASDSNASLRETVMLDRLLLDAEVVCEEYALREPLGPPQYWCEIVIQIPREAFRQTPDSLQTEAQEWSEANRQKQEEYFKESELDTIQIGTIKLLTRPPHQGGHKTTKQ